MRRERPRTMGERKSSLVGRMIAVKKTFRGDSVDCRAERRAGLPVSLRRRRARRARMAGGYDSRWKMRQMMKKTLVWRVFLVSEIKNGALGLGGGRAYDDDDEIEIPAPA